jgi:hypothetical protein
VNVIIAPPCVGAQRELLAAHVERHRAPRGEANVTLGPSLLSTELVKVEIAATGVVPRSVSG